VIPLSKAEVGVVLGLTLYVRGSLGNHARALESFVLEASQGSWNLRFSRCRSLSESVWSAWPAAPTLRDLHRVLDLEQNLTGCRGIELGLSPAGAELTPALRLVDLASAANAERNSHLSIVFQPQTSAQTVVECAQRLFDLVPWDWGSGGLSFVRESGSTYTAGQKIVRLAKRYWCINIEDVGLLQNVATTEGIGPINWLTLVGHGLAARRSFASRLVSSGLRDGRSSGVHTKICSHGVLFAAGAEILRGDINRGEDLSAYGEMATYLQPLLREPLPHLLGPYFAQDISDAWLNRFTDPQAWLNSHVEPSVTLA
jgi:hypothetical protein